MSYESSGNRIGKKRTLTTTALKEKEKKEKWSL